MTRLDLFSLAPTSLINETKSSSVVVLSMPYTRSGTYAHVDEHFYLVGMFLSVIAYGVHLTLFLRCFQLLWRRSPTVTRDVFYMTYISLLFILGNIGNGSNIKFTLQAFSDNRDYPGGPFAYTVEKSTDVYYVLSNCTYIVNSWFTDALILYRFWRINGNVAWFVLAFPCLMFAASFCLSLLLIVVLNKPGMTLWSSISIRLGIPYWSISIALNVILTLLICFRLLRARQKLRRISPTLGSNFVSISAMLVESAALYAVNGIILLVSYAVDSSFQHVALPLLGQTQSIAPLLIIMRVAEGTAWTRETANAVHTRSLSFTLATSTTSSIISEKMSDSTVIASQTPQGNSSSALDADGVMNISSHNV